MTDLALIERISGARTETGAYQPFIMDDRERVHFVEQGYLDVFAVELRDQEVMGRRRFVARVSAGGMAFGSRRVVDTGADGHAFGFLAVPSLNAVITHGSREGVAADHFDLAATNWIDEWIANVSQFLVRERPPPRNALLLEADPDVPYPAGTALSAQHRDIIWVAADAPMRLVGRDDMVVDQGELLPITEHTWLEIDTDAGVSSVYTPTALVRGQLWPYLDRFMTRVLEFAIVAEAETASRAGVRRRKASAARRAAVADALRQIGEVLGVGNDGGTAGAAALTSLQEAVALVARSCGASLEPQTPADPNRSLAENLDILTSGSGIRTRWIALPPRWWRRDGPSFVGFVTREDGQEKPLALISQPGGGYRAVTSETDTPLRLNRRTAAAIADRGLAFYAPLPDRVDDGNAVLRFAMHRCGRDLRTLLWVGVLGGLGALLVPILTGIILTSIIPRADIPLWMAAVSALLLMALGRAVFDIVGGLALLRVEGRVDERLQAAIWSRLVSLPVSFFQGYTVGDLADRANGISEARRRLGAAAVQAAMGSLFSVLSLGLLFYFHWSLALFVSALILVLTTTTMVLSRVQLRHHRAAFRAQGAVNGFVFQMISGLAKLRVAHAENYALARWAERYAEQRQEALVAVRWAAGQQVLVGMFRPLALMAIFASAHHTMTGGAATSFDLASFLSFNAAFGQLTGAAISVTTAVTTVVAVVPMLERTRPILEARPETSDGGIDPGDLKGDIELANVTFCYSSDEANVIDGISLRINQGDYVALVGPSGCGKSTIYRLLLGFERPSSGTVFLDGHDLSSLDLIAVRKRMGVVLQNGQIVAGSIYENIAGMVPLSSQDAWAAVRAAALEDDIRAMPMGMRTVLPEGGVGLSTGQKQRLLIARALARKPRVLLFDEATSALDNRAQAIVQASLKRLGITRVVIAHRLSSIRDVDRIYVMDGGRIVESGRYDDLMQRDEVFASLARRQLVQA